MEEKTEDKIIVFPEYKELTDKIKKLRAELPMILQERDTLLAIDCQNIRMKYMLLVGALECQEYREECDFLRLKRKLEMIRAKKNRREPVEIDAIEAFLDEEFEIYRVMLDDRLHELDSMLELSRGKLLSESEVRELKDLYYRIIKALHPDLHPELTGEELNLFYKAVDAYETGDIMTLRVISESIADPKQIDDDGAMTELVDTEKHLREMLDAAKGSIAEIKNSFPYNMKDKVKDDDWVKAKREELQDSIDNYKEQSARYSADINEMLTGSKAEKK